MIKRLKSRRIVLNDCLFNGFVYVQNGRIKAVTKDDLPFDEEIDLGDKFLAPGFIDLHVHGGNGVDFGNCSSDEVRRAVDFHQRHGTTAMLATLAAAPLAEMEKAAKRVRLAGCPTVLGVHFEGPYLSPTQCGAQGVGALSLPDETAVRSLLQRSNGYIRRWTYAPELDKDGTFCRTIREGGVIPSAGHTDAVLGDLQTAYREGCRLITHLYSCTSTVTRTNGYRNLGTVEFAFLEDDVFAEIIADGKHLPPELIRLIVKLKGRERVLLVTDALSAAGSLSPCGDLNGVAYVVEDGVCKLPDRTAFAGSIATTDRLVRTCVKEVGLSVVDSVYMASTAPAEVLGIQKGRIEAGYDADLVVFDDDIRVTAVYLGGERSDG